MGVLKNGVGRPSNETIRKYYKEYQKNFRF